jgi:hypothetical protein
MPVENPTDSDDAAAASASQAQVDLMGLKTICWKCDGESIALVGVSPHDGADLGNFVQCNDDDVLPIVAALLPPNSPQVGEIKPRESRTAGYAYLSNGCVHCDALFGNIYLFHDELLEVLLTKGLAGLEVIATVTAPAEWDPTKDGFENLRP